MTITQFLYIVNNDYLKPQQKYLCIYIDNYICNWWDGIIIFPIQIIFF